MSRQEYNELILSILYNVVKEHPCLRFGQILANLGVVEYVVDNSFKVKDPFYEESEVTYKRILENKNKYRF